MLRIFGISGLRGVVGTELTPESVSRIAAVFGRFAGPGTVCIGRDTRPSGAMFLSAAAAGLLSTGADVEDLGICPTPTVLLRVRRGHLAGGVVVTASHNPEQWNGMKFIGPDGMFLVPDELVRFRKLVETDDSIRIEWNGIGHLTTYAGAVDDHIAAIAESDLFSDIPVRLANRKLRVGIDAVNGAASQAAARLVSGLGAEPVALNCETDHRQLCSGFPRRPEPTADNLEDLSRLVREQKLDLGVAFDPDGDRVGFVDETGTPLGEEATVCLACMYVLPRRIELKKPVVANLSTTRAVEDVCKAFSVPVERTPVGEISVAARMKSIGSVVGGEGNGGVILPEINSTRDGLVATACALGLLASGRTASELRAGIPEYRMLKTTVSLDRARFDAARKHLARAFEGARRDDRDGLKLDAEDFWIHIRASNTEPVVRIVVETRGTVSPEPIAEKVASILGDTDSPAPGRKE
jgi:phosphomannomutase